MSGLLAAIGLGLIGLAIGAALQRWGDADRATHGHKDYEPDWDRDGLVWRPAIDAGNAEEWFV